mmetsp:Transcript_118759/g.265138  ORF Transcript_118759/g.265138 Transcript_118759/m.265138 type:complete len:218 (-) Transcript_118759:240-893(-)
MVLAPPALTGPRLRAALREAIGCRTAFGTGTSASAPRPLLSSPLLSPYRGLGQEASELVFFITNTTGKISGCIDSSIRRCCWCNSSCQGCCRCGSNLGRCRPILHRSIAVALSMRARAASTSACSEDMVDPGRVRLHNEKIRSIADVCVLERKSARPTRRAKVSMYGADGLARVACAEHLQVDPAVARRHKGPAQVPIEAHGSNREGAEIRGPANEA